MFSLAMGVTMHHFERSVMLLPPLKCNDDCVCVDARAFCNHALVVRRHETLLFRRANCHYPSRCFLCRSRTDLKPYVRIPLALAIEGWPATRSTRSASVRSDDATSGHRHSD